jgi:hypothetical protein
MARTLIVAGLLLAMGQALAQKLPEGMTMHRLQAGEPDASGWMLAASTEGGFSVKLPLKFNDFRIDVADTKEPVLRSHSIGTRSSEGIKFSATRVVYRKGAESAKLYFARFERGEALQARPERLEARRIGEWRAVETDLKRTSDVAYQRVLLLGADLMLMIVEAPRAHDRLARQFAQSFFDSLVVTQR